jgi:hypothetical protein
LADWRCLTAAEQSIVTSLGYDPEPMAVSRVGDEHWMFKDLKTQEELIVRRESGGYRGTVIQAGYAPERRSDLH